VFSSALSSATRAKNQAADPRALTNRAIKIGYSATSSGRVTANQNAPLAARILSGAIRSSPKSPLAGIGRQCSCGVMPGFFMPIEGPRANDGPLSFYLNRRGNACNMRRALIARRLQLVGAHPPERIVSNQRLGVRERQVTAQIHGPQCRVARGRSRNRYC